MVATRFCWTSARALGCFLAVMAAFLVVLLLPGKAHAAELVVDRSDDPNLFTTPKAGNCTLKADDCSLRGR
jgi:hypothetical protein